MPERSEGTVIAESKTLEEAAERFVGGDALAFQELVGRTSGKLVRLSARMLGNVADAEDVVQEVYIKAYHALLGGQFDRLSRLETWLYRIAVNTTIDAKRKRRRLAADELGDVSMQGGPSAEASVALRELSEWLGQLPEEQQVALVLKSVDGLSSGEIAQILDCSEGAVEQRLVRARATLRERSGS